MRTLIWYEAVQVVSRHPDGALAEWYPADNEERRAQRFSAIEDRDNSAEEFSGTEYTVIETRIVECGQPRIGKVKVVSAKKAAV